MATETLTFHCPYCSIRLTVPVSLAGVKGPCPSCRAPIAAPLQVPQLEPEPETFPESPAEPDLEAEPEALPEPEPAATLVMAPLPEATARREALEEAAPEPVDVSEPLPPASAAQDIPEDPEPSIPSYPVPIPVEVTPPEASGEEATDAEGPKIRPEPRGMKDRAHGSPIATRHSTADDRLRRAQPVQHLRGKPSSRFLRLTIPAVFCAAATTVSYLLCYFFLPYGPTARIKEASGPLDPPPAPANGAAASSPSGDQPPAPPPPDGAFPPGHRPSPSAVDEGMPPALAANELLEAFLRAPNAAARVGMVEPAATIAELEAFPLLKGPIWEIAQIFTDLPQHDPVERTTDFPYRVSFFLPSKRNVDFAMLVRQRGGQTPKVFLPAFLDLAGGRLATFTASPNTLDPAKFHVVLEAVSGCHEDTVPNADRKFTFKLLSSPIGKETARSYVSTGSRFKKMVEDPSSSLRWATRVRATVTLQWNHSEDPARPYLELIDINSLGWNP